MSCERRALVRPKHHEGRRPRIIAAGIAAAGIVYHLGSSLRFFAPVLFDAFAPAYDVTVLTEGAFCLVLLSGWTLQRKGRAA